jgi:hypothetical protein
MLKKINSIIRVAAEKKYFLIIMLVTLVLPLSIEVPHFIWHGDDIFIVNDIERNLYLQKWIPYNEIASSRLYLVRFYSLFYSLFSGNEQALAILNLSLRFASALIFFKIIKKFLDSNFQTTLLVFVWFFQAQNENNYEYAGFLYNLVILILFIIIFLYIDINQKTYLKIFVIASLMLLSLNLYEILAPLTLIPILIASLRVKQFKISKLTGKNIFIIFTPLIIFLYHVSYMGNYYDRNPGSPDFISKEAPFHFIRVILAGLNINFGVFGIERIKQGFVRFTILLQEVDFLVVNVVVFAAIILYFLKRLKSKNIELSQGLGINSKIFLGIIVGILTIYIFYITGIINFDNSQLNSIINNLNTSRFSKVTYVFVICLVFLYLINKVKQNYSNLRIRISEYEIGIVGLLFIILGYTTAFKMVEPFPQDIPLRLTLIAQIGVTLVLIPFAKEFMNMGRTVFNSIIFSLIILNYMTYSQDYYNFNRQTSNYLKLSQYILDNSKIDTIKISMDTSILFDLTKFNFESIDKKYFVFDRDQYAVPKHLYNVLLNKFDKENKLKNHSVANGKKGRDIYNYFKVCVVYPAGREAVCHSTHETVRDKVFLITSP